MSPPQQWGGGGGGGFQPPGGGGGFGPPPGGGGGFGPPPGGGGGFSPPPGGGPTPPAGGFGGGGPPPGGEGALGRIPFSPEDEKNISQTVLFMRIAGAVAILNSLFSLVGSIGVGLYRHMPLAPSVCGGLIGLVVQLALGAMLLVASSAFSKVASSDGEDQRHLANGLKQLRWYFLVKAILWLFMILLCCGCVLIMIVAGGAAFAALSGR